MEFGGVGLGVELAFFDVALQFVVFADDLFKHGGDGLHGLDHGADFAGFVHAQVGVQVAVGHFSGKGGQAGEHAHNAQDDPGGQQDAQDDAGHADDEQQALGAFVVGLHFGAELVHAVEGVGGVGAEEFFHLGGGRVQIVSRLAGAFNGDVHVLEGFMIGREVVRKLFDGVALIEAHGRGVHLFDDVFKPGQQLGDGLAVGGLIVGVIHAHQHADVHKGAVAVVHQFKQAVIAGGQGRLADGGQIVVYGQGAGLDDLFHGLLRIDEAFLNLVGQVLHGVDFGNLRAQFVGLRFVDFHFLGNGYVFDALLEIGAGGVHNSGIQGEHEFVDVVVGFTNSAVGHVAVNGGARVAAVAGNAVGNFAQSQVGENHHAREQDHHN